MVIELLLNGKVRVGPLPLSTSHLANIGQMGVAIPIAGYAQMECESKSTPVQQR